MCVRVRLRRRVILVLVVEVFVFAGWERVWRLEVGDLEFTDAERSSIAAQFLPIGVYTATLLRFRLSPLTLSPSLLLLTVDPGSSHRGVAGPCTRRGM